MKTTRPTENLERVFLVGVGLKRAAHVPGIDAGDAERASLEELAELARSAGAHVAGSMFQMRDKIDPATVIGRGKIDEVKIEADMRHAPLIIFDRNLSPTQLRNLEKGTECRVIDRTQLILDIFARHARSREGQLQVELAQLNYSLPRLAGSAKALSRQAGGIGTRGPGEQKLETDRRRIRDRISKITKAIEALRRQRSLRRQTRQAVPLGTVALVGYTNVGKSTLFNSLSRAGVLVSSKMFATLDPTVRAVRLPSNRRVLLSDTVGFIRDLPPGLIAAFRATLEEVQESALLLLVTDVSNPHHTEQDAEVEKILKELGVADRPRLHVLNKIDRLSPEEAAAVNGNHNSALVSGLTGQGLDVLLSRIDEAMPVDPLLHLSFTLPLSNGRAIALVHSLGRVLHSEVRDSSMAIEAEIPESVARQLKIEPNATPA
ncbi:MAG TPA: GTPase HflX [Candidatus Acidoferrales bacterium]|nr:GTPase HflX [Candidatus Acidoferrales bacterium]